MSEEEIIHCIELCIENKGIPSEGINWVKGLLDLYNKTKNQLEEKTYLYNKLETESKYLIEKQQKEIESLKIIHETYKEEIKSIEDRYINKDKVREKIKELEEKEKKCNFTGLITECEIKIETLKELLEE